MVTEQDILNTGMVGLVEVLNGSIQAPSTNSYRQNLVANNLFASLEPAAAFGLLARGQVGYVLEHQEEYIQTLRLPDVSYLRHLPESKTYTFMYSAPDLAVKVKADHESAEELERLVDDYLGAGSQQVWLIYPRDEEVYVYYSQHSLECYGADDELVATAIFPVRVAINIRDLFQYPWHKRR